MLGIAWSRAEQGEGEKIDVVASQKLPNVPGKSITAIRVSYAPGGKSGKPRRQRVGLRSFWRDPLGELCEAQRKSTSPARVSSSRRAASIS
jgi:hypothetical protein